MPGPKGPNQQIIGILAAEVGAALADRTISSSLSGQVPGFWKKKLIRMNGCKLNITQRLLNSHLVETLTSLENTEKQFLQRDLPSDKSLLMRITNERL